MTATTPRVGYVLKMYPRFSETFIVHEILQQEAAGTHVEVFSLRLPIDGRFHEALARVHAPVTYLSREHKASSFWALSTASLPWMMLRPTSMQKSPRMVPGAAC